MAYINLKILIKFNLILFRVLLKFVLTFINPEKQTEMCHTINMCMSRWEQQWNMMICFSEPRFIQQKDCHLINYFNILFLVWVLRQRGVLIVCLKWFYWGVVCCIYRALLYYYYYYYYYYLLRQNGSTVKHRLYRKYINIIHDIQN